MARTTPASRWVRCAPSLGFGARCGTSAPWLSLVAATSATATRATSPGCATAPTLSPTVTGDPMGLGEQSFVVQRPHRVLWLAKGLGRGGAEQLLAGCARHV